MHSICTASKLEAAPLNSTHFEGQMWFYPNKYTHVLIHVSFLLQVLTFVALEPYVFFPQCALLLSGQVLAFSQRAAV